MSISRKIISALLIPTTFLVTTLFAFAAISDQATETQTTENIETEEGLWTSSHFDVTEQVFSDVSEGNPYFVAINTLADKGYIKGYENNTFQPNKDVSRAEALKMITMVNKSILPIELEDVQTEYQPFLDVSQDLWAFKYITLAKEKGIIKGRGNGQYFEPKETVMLAEALKMLLVDEDIDYSPYSEATTNDLVVGSYWEQYGRYAIAKGLVNIYPSNTINPEQTLTRGYLAEILYRYLQAKEGAHFGKATFYGAAVHGNGTASGERFDMYAYTAAHKTLPFHSLVRVTNLANGQYVDVKITDRGPYGPGRVIDLTSTAFEDIAWLGTGVINVEYKVLEYPE